jgi:hypothetical protein
MRGRARKSNARRHLSKNVRNAVLGCDALFAFLTRREEGANGKWATHRWVVEELVTAIHQMPTVEIRESNVDPQAGMPGGHQRVDYDEAGRDACLVQIAQIIGVLRSDFLKRTTFKNVRLGPDKFIGDVRKLVGKTGFQCQYRIRRDTYESSYQSVEVRRVAGGLYVWLKGVTETDLVEIIASYGAQTWRSDFEPVDAVTIQLTED